MYLYIYIYIYLFNIYVYYIYILICTKVEQVDVVFFSSGELHGAACHGGST
jgi:hypothetical protein